MSTTPTENLEQIYDAQLKSQKSQLTQNYEQALSELDASKQTAQKQLDQNLNATTVEAQRAAKNYNEVQNAYGLTSGARAQARLAQDNQLQADLTTLRAAHQNAEAETERQRTLLGQQYASAIAQAQAENDMQKAQALYEEAKQKEAELTAKQESAAALMAQAGDFSLYGQLYGLTPEQISKLQGAATKSYSVNTGNPWDNIPDARTGEIANRVYELVENAKNETAYPYGVVLAEIQDEDSSIFLSDAERALAQWYLEEYFNSIPGTPTGD